MLAEVDPLLNAMRLVSVNIGVARKIGTSRGADVVSGIVKQPVEGPVAVTRLNLEGDEQADLSVHGGPDKAAYAYPSEHYHYWREKFLGMEMPWGTFGENFTTEGLYEDQVHIGDLLAIGSARFKVTGPRLPCYKLGLRFGTAKMIRSFFDSGRTGFYLQVLKEGNVEAGEAIELLRSDPASELISSRVRRMRQSQE